MAKTSGGLTKWFKEDWVDIGSKKKGGGYAKCGRTKQKKDAKRKYPKCVPRAKANAMSKSQIKSAVKRKRASPMSNLFSFFGCFVILSLRVLNFVNTFPNFLAFFAKFIKVLY